jgi:hypothetical protein
MKIVTNEKLIKRNSTIGQVATISSLVILGGGFFLSVQSRDPNMIGVMWGALLLGFLLSQLGIYFGNRWGRRPRPDEVIDQSLKGMDDRYAIYHYTTPAAHVLVGPAGVWVLGVFTQAGKIIYDAKKKRWQQKGGNIAQKYLRVFAQEGLGRPELEIEIDLEKITKHLQSKLPEGELPEIQAALVFIHPNADLSEVGEPPIPTLVGKDLKEYLRKTTKGKALSAEQIKQINESLG